MQSLFAASQTASQTAATMLAQTGGTLQVRCIPLWHLSFISLYRQGPSGVGFIQYNHREDFVGE